MNLDELKKQWLAEEAVAQIHGWDFSHIRNRYDEETQLGWNYEAIIHTLLNKDMHLLDLETGGGEFLLSLHHPLHLCSATEGYPPNVQLCRETLLPLGINFKEASDTHYPFEDESFDIVINRHGNYDPQEVYRILKPNGYFITQQVGAENDRELVELLLNSYSLPFPDQYLSIAKEKLKQTGFKILEAHESFTPIRFYDVGALVWFAHIIEWEFVDFSVEECFKQLCIAQQIIEEKKELVGSIHRYLLVTQKPSN